MSLLEKRTAKLMCISPDQASSTRQIHSVVSDFDIYRSANLLLQMCAPAWGTVGPWGLTYINPKRVTSSLDARSPRNRSRSRRNRADRCIIAIGTTVLRTGLGTGCRRQRAGWGPSCERTHREAGPPNARG